MVKSTFLLLTLDSQWAAISSNGAFWNFSITWRLFSLSCSSKPVVSETKYVFKPFCWIQYTNWCMINVGCSVSVDYFDRHSEVKRWEIKGKTTQLKNAKVYVFYQRPKQVWSVSRTISQIIVNQDFNLQYDVISIYWQELLHCRNITAFLSFIL